MAEELEAFERRGAEAEPIRVEADEVLEAIAEGRDIRIEYAVIDGDLDIQKIKGQLEQDERGRLLLKGYIEIRNSEVSENADFSSAKFSGNADFSSAKFSRKASFRSAKFSGNTYFMSAKFFGDANFTFAGFSGNADFNSTEFSRYASFSFAGFSGNADFNSAKFFGNANFISAEFSGNAHFNSAKFSRKASFMSAKFSGDAYFMFAEFSEDAIVYFWAVAMGRPASFADVMFSENTTLVGLWNDILHPLVWPIVWLFTGGKVKIRKKEVTSFWDMNTTVVMDGASNPYLKRYIDDEQWIRSWRERSWWRKWPLFLLWEATCHCGRSFTLWAGWSLFFALLFAIAYTPSPDWMPGHNFWQEHGPVFEQTAEAYKGESVGYWSCLYFSIVSFTTLGFGDIATANSFARVLVTLEVILGYVMLGGLISIFANKLARRS